MRAAAIDCGTNSIRLLVAERSADGGIAELFRGLQLVRLGQGVDATGEFAPEALERTLAATGDFADVIAGFGVPAAAIRFVATSAVRDAGNRASFFAGVVERLGVEPEVISGDEEAALSFAGALGGVGPVLEPVLLADIGGGSTELVLGRAGVVQQAVSLDIGSVRLRERLLIGDPPGPAEIEATRALVDAQLDGSGIDFGAARTWVGVAGTATSVAALALGLSVYDPRRVDGCTVGRERIQQITAEILDSTVAEVVARGPIPQRRAEVFPAGLVILERISRRAAADLLVSESDILDGIVAKLLGPG